MWIDSDIKSTLTQVNAVCSNAVVVKHFWSRGQRQPFFCLTKSFFVVVAWHSPFPQPPLSHRNHLRLCSVFPNIHSSLDSNNLCTVINFTLHFLPAAQLFSFPPFLWRPFRSGLTWSQEVIAVAPRFSSRSVGNGEKKALHGRGDEKYQPHRPPRHNIWLRRLFRDKQNQQGVVPEKAVLRRQWGGKKNSCAARLCNVGEMKSDVAGTRRHCRNLRFDNPTANILGHFTICGRAFFFAK